MIIAFIKKHIYITILSLILGLLVVINYTPGTFLSGWDTIHPEFDFGINFTNLINGVWRTNQGLGAIAGHSHMADIPRVLFLWIMHFVMPMDMLRYSYIFLCFILGPIGIYYLIKYLFKPAYQYDLIAFLSSLFYLLSMSTVQQFFVPFEMFTTQYAFLPWIILTSIHFIEKPTKKNFALFAIITLLSTPQAYAAHLWYPFFALYSLFLLIYFVSKHKTKKGFQKIALLFCLTLLLNAFWLVPNIYFILTSSSIPKQSKQNRIYSQEYRIRNREFGYLNDVALIKGFYFSWTIYDFEKDKSDFLMSSWREHINDWRIESIGYGLFFIVLLGILVSLLKKTKFFFIFIPFIIIPFIFLMNHTPPFDGFFDFLTKSSVFEEALRFVFTKFSILILFGYTLFFSYGLFSIFKYFASRRYTLLISVVIILALFFYSLPMFQGDLISSKMKIKIPQDYFQFWKFMKDQPDGVTLSLPLNNFSGWQYYNFGYQGSGFLWFGLKQPLLDRDFDRWSTANEQSYREFRYALYSRKQGLFANNLKKFNVKYIVWDKNVISTEAKNKSQILFENEIFLLLQDLEKQNILHLKNQFGNIFVYELVHNTGLKQVVKDPVNVSPIYQWTYKDQAYQAFSDYVTAPSNDFNEYYPYRDLVYYNDKIKPQYFSKLLTLSGHSENIILDADKLLASRSDTQVVLSYENTKKLVDIQSINEIRGITLRFDRLSQVNAYLLVIKGRNIEGLPLRICLKNLYSNVCDIYDELSKSKNITTDYFFIPPLDESFGYELYINNISYGDFITHNQLESVTIVPVSEGFLTDKQQLSITSSGSYISYFQSYHNGWKAYYASNTLAKIFPFFFGQELKDHVLVNNWANGWKLNNETIQQSNNIIVIFWPQYLEYLGFVFLILIFIFILKYKNRP